MMGVSDPFSEVVGEARGARPVREWRVSAASQRWRVVLVAEGCRDFHSVGRTAVAFYDCRLGREGQFVALIGVGELMSIGTAAGALLLGDRQGRWTLLPETVLELRRLLASELGLARWTG